MTFGKVTELHTSLMFYGFENQEPIRLNRFVYKHHILTTLKYRNGITVLRRFFDNGKITVQLNLPN